MAITYRILDTSGFQHKALDNWRRLKDGFEYADMDQAENGVACYLCFNSQSNIQELSVRTLRIRQTYGSAVYLTLTESSIYGLLLDVRMLSEPTAILDILGGMLFHEAERFIVIPPVSDAREFIESIEAALTAISVPAHELLLRVFQTIDEANHFFKGYLRLALVRDIFNQYQLDRRPVTDGLATALRSLIGYDIDLTDTSNITRELTSLKSFEIDFSLKSDWESAVLTMYNRPPPTRFSEPLADDGTQMVLRPRRSKKSYLFDIESDDEEIVEEVKPVVEIDNWLQCDKCGKWRLVTAQTLKEFETKSFTCKHGKKTCEDVSDDLVPK